MIRTFLKRTLALVGLATAALTTTQAAAATAKPALWEVSDPDTKIYLFGTIHLLPQNYAWKTRTIDRAITQADTLVVETIIDPRNPQALASELARLGFSRGLPPLANRIDPAKRPLLEAAIAKSGVPRPVFDQMETWAAAFTLLGVQFNELGLKGEHGVEETLRSTFVAAGKPVGQLETNSEQLGFFDTLPENAQRALLEGSIGPSGTMSEDFAGMLRSWASGDVEAIARTFNGSLAESPELRAALLQRRNYNWSNWIARRLAAPGTVLLAVGAGHLAGEESVQRYLQSRGFRVRRLQ
jgi:uncharacterized protein YbaP (TraB family)